MIDDRNSRFPRKQEPERKKTEEEKRMAAETLAYLESLPWRPIGVEW